MVKIKHKTHKFITPLIKVLLVKRKRLFRKGKIQQANILAKKIGRLMSRLRSEFLQETSARDTRDLWAAVNNFRSTGSNNLSVLGHPFNDCDAINKSFVDIATDPTYNRENVMSFLRESDHEYTQYFEQYQFYRFLSFIKRTSSGCEPIPYWVYKHCAIELTPII